MAHDSASPRKVRRPMQPLPLVRRAAAISRIGAQRVDDLPFGERRGLGVKADRLDHRAPAAPQPRRNTRRRPARVLAPPPTTRVPTLFPVRDRRCSTLNPRPLHNRCPDLLRGPVRSPHREPLRAQLADRSLHDIRPAAAAQRRPHIPPDRPRSKLKLSRDRHLRHPSRVQTPRRLDPLEQRQLQRRPIRRQPSSQQRRTPRTVIANNRPRRRPPRMLLLPQTTPQRAAPNRPRARRTPLIHPRRHPHEPGPIAHPLQHSLAAPRVRRRLYLHHRRRHRDRPPSRPPRPATGSRHAQHRSVASMTIAPRS